MWRPSRKRVLTFLATGGIVAVLLVCSFFGIYGIPGRGIPRSSDDTLTPETERKIRALIEKLASKNSRPKENRGWRVERYPDDWDDRHQEIVYDAEKDLSDFGKTAFPILLEHLDDERFSLIEVSSDYYNQSVGQVCRMIIENNVEVIPEYYKSCPHFFSGTYHDLKYWWWWNRNKTLKQMRIDAARWRIRTEERINGKGREFLDEMRKELTDIEADKPREMPRRWSALYHKSLLEKNQKQVPGK